MSNFEGYKDRKQFQNIYTVPSVAMRGGDFSSVPVPLLDPTQCTVSGTGAAAVRNCAAFPGNQIPTNRIDPISVKLLEFYPEPNAAGHGQQLRVPAESRHQQGPVHTARRLRAELELDVDGPLQLRQRRRNLSGAEAERHEAAQPCAPGDGREHPHPFTDGRQ